MPFTSRTLTLTGLALVMPLSLTACSGEKSEKSAPNILPELPTLASAASIRDVSIEEASALIAGDEPVVVLDVRTPGEFEAGHIEGAINVDVMSETFIEDLAQADGRSIAFGMLGGIIWNLGNLLLVAAIAVAGLAVMGDAQGDDFGIGGDALRDLDAPAGKLVF